MLANSRIIIRDAQCAVRSTRTGNALRCVLTGDVVLSAASKQTVLPIRDAAYDQADSGAATIRFAIDAPAEVGGRVGFYTKLDAERGWMEDGRLLWMHGFEDEQVATWTARRVR